ncbi:MAG: Gfo/Idh/MocA family oxidoreductase, partial [Desulfobulbaceae bacterium]|nr:Gfo/Idh/MocA family oxidoreductase [Desulfobulbaceae bacterium]
MKNVGIIGTGKHGSRYATHIVKDISSLNLKAICRRGKEGEEQAREWGVKYHKEWKKLIHDKDVDAVISVVPPWLNLGIAQECSRVNKPLLIEKPLAVNGKQAREIVSYMESCQLTVAQTLRFNPVIQSIKKRINDMGKIYSIHANQRLEPSSLAWHDKKEIAGAGVLIHTAVHIFDALHYITGKKITRVMAASYRYHSKVLEDLVTLLFEMEGGIVGTVDISKVGHGRSGGYEFVCEKGQFQADQV